jgi:hypothetical protein
MVEPYTPEFRQALKAAHPGLRDADIDRFEALTARRNQMLPDREADAIANLNHEIDELVRTKMPEFDRIARQDAAIKHAGQAARPSPKVEVRPKR